MKLISKIFICILFFAFVSNAVAFNAISPQLDIKTPPSLKERSVNDGPIPPQTPQEFSGHYLFNGRLFYYDQESGEFTPVEGDKESGEKNALADNITEQSDEKRELLDDLGREEDSFDRNYEAPISLTMLASDSQDFDNDLLSCKEWGSPLIRDRVFSSKDDCEEELSSKKDEALQAIDRYLEKFEEEKTQLMIKAELEDYERLSNIKLRKQQTVDIILEAFNKGCKCLY
jgi:hypothetical protein